jgi:hypothetical protein
MRKKYGGKDYIFAVIVTLGCSLFILYPVIHISSFLLCCCKSIKTFADIDNALDRTPISVSAALGHNFADVHLDLPH